MCTQSLCHLTRSSGAQRLSHQLCLSRHQTHLGRQKVLLVNKPMKQEHFHKGSRMARWACAGPRLRTSTLISPLLLRN